MIEIGSRLEPLWDDYLIDEANSTAEKRCHEPVARGPIFAFEKPWERRQVTYHHILHEKDGTMRMYYIAVGDDPGSQESSKGGARANTAGASSVRVCMLLCRDGVNWERPSLGVCSFGGSTDNNIVFDSVLAAGDGYAGESLDNFYVFRDEKPGIPEDERYKAVYLRAKMIEDRPIKPLVDRSLLCAFSADGIHWRLGYRFELDGSFDSLNTVHYIPEKDTYLFFFRGLHTYNTTAFTDIEFYNLTKQRFRDIRIAESRDFRTFTEQKLLDFKGHPDYELYTNVISRYYRAPHVFTGFPTRYTERPAWPDSFDKMSPVNLARRQERSKRELRMGTAVTDCVFMSSRDGYVWDRCETAFMRPGPETDTNWVYGDCYPALGFYEVPGILPGQEPVIAMVANSTLQGFDYRHLIQYTIRRDGFISRHAGEEECTLLTKCFIPRARKLYMNFSTSARGYIRVEVLDQDCHPLSKLCSDEIFGDNTDREVSFPEDFATCEHRIIRLRIRMRDADLYALRFA